MEENLIEKYVIDQIKEKTEENEKLKEQIRSLTKENLALKNAKDDGCCII